MLYKPNGEPAGGTDRIMVLSEWARELQRRYGNRLHFLAMGKPTFPVDPVIGESFVQSGTKMAEKSRKAYALLEDPNATRDDVVLTDSALGYGAPQGKFIYQEKIARAFTEWYGNQIEIKAENILFNIGAVGALFNCFKYLNDQYPNGYIMTPTPFYSMYQGVDGSNRLFPIDVMKQKGYKLTADALLEGIMQAKQQGKDISAFLFCDPNNPLGTVVGREEWQKIAVVLREHFPNAVIILDEAYAEMVLNGEKNVSLIQVAPDLLPKVIVIRSATKGISAAGLRLAATITFNKELVSQLLKYNIATSGHMPEILQEAYADAMEQIDVTKHAKIIGFYATPVRYIEQRLHKLGAAMPDPDYKVEGTFYVMADLSDLLGQPLCNAAKEAFGYEHTGIIETDEDIIFHLAFQEKFIIAPLSYYGVDAKKGYVRFTCSGTDVELKEVTHRLERALQQARSDKYMAMVRSLNQWFYKTNRPIFIKADPNVIAGKSALELKEMMAHLDQLMSFNTTSDQASHLIIMQALSRAHLARKNSNIELKEVVKDFTSKKEKYSELQKQQAKLLLDMSKVLYRIPSKRHPIFNSNGFYDRAVAIAGHYGSNKYAFAHSDATNSYGLGNFTWDTRDDSEHTGILGQYALNSNGLSVDPYESSSDSTTTPNSSPYTPSGSSPESQPPSSPEKKGDNKRQNHKMRPKDNKNHENGISLKRKREEPADETDEIYEIDENNEINGQPGAKFTRFIWST